MVGGTGAALDLIGRPKLTNPNGRKVGLPLKAFVVAARLILDEPQMRIERDALAHFLWPTAGKSTRQSNLRTLVKRIRAAQNAAGVRPLIFDDAAVAFDPTAARCDLFVLLKAPRCGDGAALAAQGAKSKRLLLEGCDDEADREWLSAGRRRIAGRAGVAAPPPHRPIPPSPSRLPLVLIEPPAAERQDPCALASAWIDELIVWLWKAGGARIVLRREREPIAAGEQSLAYRMRWRAQREPEPRLNLQLTFALSGEVVWADTQATAASTPSEAALELSARIEQHQIEQALGAAKADPSAFVLMAKADRDLRLADLSAVRRARRGYLAALRIDDKLSRAHAGVARALRTEWMLRAGPNNDALDRAADFAGRAILIDPDNARARLEYGMAHCYARRFHLSHEHLRRAVELSPEDADLKIAFAESISAQGDHAEALRQIEAACRPGEALGDMAGWARARTLLLSGEPRKAIETVGKLSVTVSAMRVTALSLAMMGEREQAIGLARQVFRTSPGLSGAAWANMCPLERREDRQLISEGFRSIGL